MKNKIEIEDLIRQRIGELEHTNALLIAEIVESKKALTDCQKQLTLLQNTQHQNSSKDKIYLHLSDTTLTKQQVLQMKLKDFCDSRIEPVFGSRFWRYVVNSKKAFEPMFPMHQLMDYTVQNFYDDIRCRTRIKKNYNNETLDKAVLAFAQFQIFPFGIKQ